jgi:hypothetical protein
MIGKRQAISLSLVWLTAFIANLSFAAEQYPKPYHPSYETAPNPQLMPDELISLENQPWKFAVGANPTSFPHQINFGYAPESDLSGVDYEKLRDPRSSKDIVWYEKQVMIPEHWEGGVLTFEGVDRTADVFIDGKHVMRHVGGYAPFDIELNNLAHSGKKVDGGTLHTIRLRAEDDRSNRGIAVGKQERRPNEGVIFYGNSTGAWKGAHIRRVGKQYIAKAQHQANADGTFKSTVTLGGAVDKESELEVELIDRATSKPVGTAKVPVKDGKANVSIKIAEPKLWHPDSPELYDVQMKLTQAGKTSDSIRSYIGFRDFEQKQGHFFLNGKPTYLRGVLNQMVFPKGLYTPDTPEDNAKDLKAIREHGFNFQRVHNTTPRWRDIYEMENGVLAQDPATGTTKRMGVGWALEMPSARDLRNPQALDQFLKEWGEIVQAYGHGHPGLYYFVPGNEDWGLLEDKDHFSRVTDAKREKFQKLLYRTTIKNGPPGALVSVEDGWRQISGRKYGRNVADVNASQLIVSSHDYRESGDAIRKAYSKIPLNAKPGTPMPANQKPLFMTGYEFTGDKNAFIVGEFAGKSLAPPGAKNVFGYGKVYQNVGKWERDSLDQLRAVGEAPIIRGGYVYTQVRDAGNKPHRATRPGEPGGELNGFLYADGRPKGDPKKWAKVNLENQSDRERYIAQFFRSKPEYRNNAEPERKLGSTKAGVGQCMVNRMSKMGAK